jgi:putative signal transducing protein
LEIDPDEFRRRYAELSDDALLDMNRDELVDIARDCYDAELASRGLHPDSPPEPEVQAGEEEGDMVELTKFSSSSEVDLARALLASAAIPSYLENELGGKYLPGSEGFRLFVAATSLEDARQVLQSSISDEELAAQAEAEPPPEDADDQSTSPRD